MSDRKVPFPDQSLREAAERVVDGLHSYAAQFCTGKVAEFMYEQAEELQAGLDKDASTGTAPQEAQADPQPDAPKAPFWSRDHDPLRVSPVAPAPQRPKADPKMVTCFQCRGDGTCFATDDPCPVCGGLGSITDDIAPVPQTEGECPEPFCRNGIMGAGITRRSCPVCRAQQKADEGTGLEKEES